MLKLRYDSDMAITLQKSELKNAIREGVREALADELARSRAVFLPYVSEKEQKDIEKRYGKPTRKAAKITSKN